MTKERRIMIEWPELNISVEAMLEDARNPELCEEIWRELPFECIQDHGVVTGQIIYCWTPVISIAPVKVAEKHTEAPVGRISFSQATGNKIIIKYGPCTEDIAAPVLAKVVDEDLEKLRVVGKQIWESTFYNKKLYRVIFRRKEG
jgi:hypothetical protein